MNQLLILLSLSVLHICTRTDIAMSTILQNFLLKLPWAFQ